MRTSAIFVTGLAAVSAAFISGSAFAGAHTWRILEAFSTADGTVQYIELKESFGGTGEIFLGGAPVSSNSHTFNFPGNLSGNTANRSILLATSAFAALPGAPAPDYIIPANFFSPAGDTLKYNVYDTWNTGPVPTDCVLALAHNLGPNGGTNVTNTPSNYAGTTGTVNACPVPECLGDTNSSHTVDIDDLVVVITNWGQTGTNPGDVNHSNAVNIDDLVSVITHWGACP